MAAKLCVVDCIADRVWLAIPQATVWQHIGDQIDAAFVFAWSNFVSVMTHDRDELAVSPGNRFDRPVLARCPCIDIANMTQLSRWLEQLG